MGHNLKILLLSFYYQPDLCAGSFRNTALVQALLKQVPAGSTIEVITTLPNRYASFSVDVPEKEEFDNLTIQRIALPSHKSGMLDQSKAFISYARQAIKHTRGKQYDLVFASSSRLMTAALGAYIARSQKAPLYLDIRDIFVDTIKDVLPAKIARVMKPIFSQLERWAINEADKVNLVSEGFREYFEQRYPNKSLAFFTNGIDDEFMLAQPKEKLIEEKDVLTVVYAGNFGEGQGLHTIIPQLAKHFEGRLCFKLYGDGGRKGQLESALIERRINNVKLCAPVGRKELINIYQEADILFLHLNNYDAFLKVLPSKIFEYGALGKPIWAGVAGYSAQFLESYVSNSAVFEPCDLNSAISTFEQLDVVTAPRCDFVAKFSRDSIMQGMAADIVAQVK
jgi:hypothetical protein